MKRSPKILLDYKITYFDICLEIAGNYPDIYGFEILCKCSNKWCLFYLIIAKKILNNAKWVLSQ